MTGNRPPRTWRAYELIGVPSRNRTLDSEVLGRNVGLPVNDTRLEVFVDFEEESDARVRPERYFLVPFDLHQERGGGSGVWVLASVQRFNQFRRIVLWKAAFSFQASVRAVSCMFPCCLVGRGLSKASQACFRCPRLPLFSTGGGLVCCFVGASACGCWCWWAAGACLVTIVLVLLGSFCAQEVGVRLLEMTAEVSREANQVFRYADDAASGGEQLG